MLSLTCLFVLDMLCFLDMSLTSLIFPIESCYVSALEHSGACVIDALHWAASHGEALVVRDLAYVMFLLLLFVHDLA